MRVNLTVNVNNRPLRRTYVEHVTGPFVHGTYITDDLGRVRDNAGDLGIDSWTRNVDIRVRCQNSVARILDGKAGNIAVTQDRTNLVDGDTFNINTVAEQQDHYEILNRVITAYDVVFRQFRPFSDASRDAFPLGRLSTLSATMNQRKRIEISFPSQHLPGMLAFVEPHSASTGFPLLHLRGRLGTPDGDGRLFGEGNSRPILIAHELAHALHFSLFSDAHRQRIQTDFLGWIINDMANGGGGRHTAGKQTSPMVAYIEAFGEFAGRLSEFVRVTLQGQTVTTAPLAPYTMTSQERQAFFALEIDGPVNDPPKLAMRAPNRTAIPNAAALAAQSPPIVLTGGSDEGSVYGCIFVEFARRGGLRTAVNAYLQSAAKGVTTFGEYRTWVSSNASSQLANLNSAQVSWGL